MTGKVFNPFDDGDPFPHAPKRPRPEPEPRASLGELLRKGAAGTPKSPDAIALTDAIDEVVARLDTLAAALHALAIEVRGQARR